MDLILRQPEGNTLEFKRDLSAPEGVLRTGASRPQELRPSSLRQSGAVSHVLLAHAANHTSKLPKPLQHLHLAPLTIERPNVDPLSSRLDLVSLKAIASRSVITTKSSKTLVMFRSGARGRRSPADIASESEHHSPILARYGAFSKPTSLWTVVSGISGMLRSL